MDAQGNAYITAFTSRGDNADLLVMKLNAAGTQQLYSAVIGGGDVDAPASLVVNAVGEVYVAGQTSSTDFPGDFPTRPGLTTETFGGVCFQSNDGGASLRDSGRGLPNLLLGTVVIDPSNPATLYAGDSPMGGLSGKKLFRSADGGATWTRIGEHLNDVTELTSKSRRGRCRATPQ